MTLTIKSTKYYQYYSRKVKQTDSFSTIGKALPLIFYKDAGSDFVCPIEVTENTITGIFSTGMNKECQAFLHHCKTFIPKDNPSAIGLTPGNYLYDFKNGKIIYNYDIAGIMDERDWCSIPDTYQSCKYDYLMAIDTKGCVHKVWHRQTSFAEISWVGARINSFFEKGEYDIQKVGTLALFRYIANSFALAKATSRSVKTFIEHSFDPTGRGLPAYEIDPRLWSDVFGDKEAKDEEDDAVAYSPWLLHRMDDWNTTEASKDQESGYNLMEFIGASNYPEVLQPTYVDINIQDVKGLVEVILQPLGILDVIYDPTLIRLVDLDDILQLPTERTNFFPITMDMEVDNVS